MAASIPALAQLLKRTDIEDHEEVLKAAENALGGSKGNVEAQHIKAIALLKLDRYADAVEYIENNGAKLKEAARLEHAYALYKTGRLEDAVKVAESDSDRGSRHIEAQARYRLEDFPEAALIYKELASNSETDEAADLRINTGAVDAQLEWSRRSDLVQNKVPRREDLEAFETAYNAACGRIARGEYAQGEVLLNRARDLCNNLDDLSSTEKQSELFPITVQQIYVLIRLGKHVEAENLSKTLETGAVQSGATKAIAQINNVAITSTSENPYLTQRILTNSLNTTSSDQPFGFQTAIMKANRYALDLQSLKYGGSAASTAKGISSHPAPNVTSSSNTLSVINAAAHARNSTGKEALKLILPVLQLRPNDIGLIMTVVQLYVLTGNSGSATTLLESFLTRLEQAGGANDQDVRFAPGLVGTLASLYSSQNQRGHLQRELAKAAIYWRRKSKEQDPGTAQLLKAAGACLIQSQDEEQRKLAAEIFTDLVNHAPNDRYAYAGHVASSSEISASETSPLLTPIDRLVANVDAEALETAGIAQPSGKTAAAVSARKRPAEDANASAGNRKKIRKSRLPKDYDPSKTPDPERWLPLRDRSTYRPKGKKGKARANQLSQGAAPTADSDNSRPGTPGGEVIKQKQQGGGGKKKKGKSKW